MSERAIGVRWTVGDVSDRGFEALRLSIWGAWKVFGPEAAYAVCFNSIPLERARALTGDVPDQVIWHEASGDFPEFLRHHFDEGMAEGVGWKLAPLRFFPDRFELSLDNDCILWRLPTAVRQWLDDGDPHCCLLAEDARAMFGQFEQLCGSEPRNAGIRGLPPGFDLEAALKDVLRARPVRLASELDEQGLQVAALSRLRPPYVVSIDEVTICSPFPPHRRYLGVCGAHFVGLNARHFPWQLEGRYAEEWIRENWERHRAALYDNADISPISPSLGTDHADLATDTHKD